MNAATGLASLQMLAKKKNVANLRFMVERQISSLATSAVQNYNCSVSCQPEAAD